jgi:hypothetical protein
MISYIPKNKKINNWYCRLETFCFFEMAISELHKKEKYFLVKNNPMFNTKDIYDVYAEQYDNIDSVINRLLNIEKIWMSRHNFKDINYWDKNKNISNDHDYEITCMSAMLYNQWGDSLNVGMHCDKWIVLSLSKYTNECKDNIERTTNIKPRIINICVPETTEIFDYEFISKKKSIELIQDFLDTNKISMDFVELLEHPYFNNR